MVAHLQCLTPSAAMAGMTVANLGRTFPPSWFHLISLQECTTASAKTPHKEVKTEWSTQDPLGGRTNGEGITFQPTWPLTYSSVKFNQAATCFQDL